MWCYCAASKIVGLKLFYYQFMHFSHIKKPKLLGFANHVQDVIDDPHQYKSVEPPSASVNTTIF